MENLTRYDCDSSCECGRYGDEKMRISESGEFVKFSDVKEAKILQSGEAPVQQLKAEIAAVRKYIEDMREAKMSSESILNHVDGTLRQLSAV